MRETTNGLSVETVRELMSACEQVCVSIYLPTEKAGSDTIQNAIRFKNTLRDINRRLEAKGLRSAERKKILAPAFEQLGDDRFWQHQEHALAVFLNGGVYRHIKLPEAVEELVVITDRFHVKPLLPLLSVDDRFYVLAISQGNVSLFRGDRDQLTEMDLVNVPANLDEALRYDDRERQLQFHTGTGQPGKGGRQAIFHGHGTTTDKIEKDDIRRYCHLVDQRLKPYLNNKEAPMLLAAVEPVQSIYRECNTYPHLISDGIQNNAQRLSPKELHEEAWSILQPYFEQNLRSAVDRFNELKGSGRTSTRLKEILPAAYHGRVETLFVAVDVQQWGTFNGETGEAVTFNEPDVGREDMLDVAAIHTYSNGGRVFALNPEDVPGDESLAAIYRY